MDTHPRPVHRPGLPEAVRRARHRRRRRSRLRLPARSQPGGRTQAGVLTRVLVVGATGALRPAALELVRHGHTVAGFARSVALDGVEPIEVDWTDVAATRAALARSTFDAALLYCPTAPAESITAMCAAVTGRVVQLLPSAAAAPPFTLADLPADGRVHVLLGWTPERRWHTPEQLSAAAVEALDTGQDRVLGRIRPWSDRPNGDTPTARAGQSGRPSA